MYQNVNTVFFTAGPEKQLGLNSCFHSSSSLRGHLIIFLLAEWDSLAEPRLCALQKLLSKRNLYLELEN